MNKNKTAITFSKYREKKGLSQREVATALGYLTSQFVSNWERSISLPPLQALPVVAKLLATPDEKAESILGELVLAVIYDKTTAEVDYITSEVKGFGVSVVVNNPVSIGLSVKKLN